MDDNFYDRADEHISLSNDQLKEATIGSVSASMMYSVARFNAWVSACDWSNGQEMKESKEKTVNYFVEQYRKMLQENIDDYISNFDDYMN